MVAVTAECKSVGTRVQMMGFGNLVRLLAAPYEFADERFFYFQTVAHKHG
ncbi:hypothetical protein GCM10009636_32630 [Arthrobacter koreensis]